MREPNAIHPELYDEGVHADSKLYSVKELTSEQNCLKRNVYV